MKDFVRLAILALALLAAALVMDCFGQSAPSYQFVSAPISSRSAAATPELLLDLERTVSAAANNAGAVLTFQVGGSPSEREAVLAECRACQRFYQWFPEATCVERDGQRFCFPKAGVFNYVSDGRDWKEIRSMPRTSIDPTPERELLPTYQIRPVQPMIRQQAPPDWSLVGNPGYMTSAPMYGGGGGGACATCPTCR